MLSLEEELLLLLLLVLLVLLVLGVAAGLMANGLLDICYLAFA
jgi:hypothetical protein